MQTSAKPVFTAIKVANQAEYITNADEKTLIILFSDSGTYFDRIFPRAKPFKQQSKKPKICLITSNKELDYPFIDQYIRYDSRGDYATHPYSLTAIADTICIEYPYLFVLMQLFSNLQIKYNTCISDIQVFYFALIAHLILVDFARELR